MKYHYPEKNPCGTLAKILKTQIQNISLLWMDNCNVGERIMLNLVLNLSSFAGFSFLL